MSEEIKNLQVSAKDDLINALNKEFASSANRVYVNSIDREVAFSEINVQDQKSLTRTMASNENRQDIIYDAQCALINKACLNKSEFDIYDMLEFDRLKLMMALYQANMFQNEVKFTCEECGAENAYKVDFVNVIERLDDYDVSEKTVGYENNNFKYEVTVKYPTVRRVSDFYKSYCQKHKGLARKIRTADENLRIIEYTNLFIQTIKMTNKATKAEKLIEMNKFAVADVEDILAAFPQDFLYSDNGIIKYIADNCISPLNNMFDKHECAQCGAIHEKEGVNQAESFF